MKLSTIFMAMTVVAALSGSTAFAADEMEQCKVIKDGKGLIMAGKADCAQTGHSACTAQNKAGDLNAFINVPKGQCAKINAGDFTGVSADIKAKIEGAK